MENYLPSDILEEEIFFSHSYKIKELCLVNKRFYSLCKNQGILSKIFF